MVVHSCTTVNGNGSDNALCESFLATLECKLIDRINFATPGEARRAGFEFIEGWYNPDMRIVGSEHVGRGPRKAQDASQAKSFLIT